MPPRHARPVLLVLALFAFVALGVGLLVLAPPGAEPSAVADAPVRAQPPRPATPAASTLIERGQGAPVELGYAFDPDAPTRYALELEQTMVLSGQGRDTTVRTSIRSDVLVEASHEDPSLLFVSFEDYAIDIDSDGEEVEIPALETLLRGLKLQVVLDPKQGLGEDTMVVAINPQARRMLSLLIDALRQSHPAYPAEPVAEGASWEQNTAWEADEGELANALVLSRRYRLGSALVLTAELSLAGSGSLDAKTVQTSGKGTQRIELAPAGKLLRRATTSFDFEQRVGDPADPLVQRIGLRYELAAEDP